MKNKMQGFTLIELMVVITIIGILATIVIINLSKTLGRGQDTSILDQMSEIRAQGVAYYQDNYGYSSSSVASVISKPCLSTSGLINTTDFSNTFFNDADFVRSAQGLLRNSSVIPTCYLGAATSPSVSQSYAIVSKLKSGKYWCVDSSGAAVTLPNTVINTSVTPEVSCQ